ncbi:PdaC/SigV domain-containing protein [Myroides injenensis]|uniref:PdaC/SigV domain-containing protein n=1 Tax=Myroides injenensis TaxID=1183151 RepID=UPI000289306A|nr:DUF4163 domain-containing protein [Myroides injenensis]
MKKIYLLAVLALCMVNCKDKNTSDKSNSITIETREFHGEVDENCVEDNCTEISIEVPIITAPENSAIALINTTILNEVTEIASFEENLSDTSSYDDLISSFITAYTSFIKKYTGEDLPWKAKIKVSTTFQNNEIYALNMEYYTFAGGAHGFKGEKSLLFDLETGKQINAKELIKDWTSLSQIISDKLAYADDITEDGVLNYPEDIQILEDTIIFGYTSSISFPISDTLDTLVLNKKEVASFFNYNIFKEEVSETK